MVLPSQGGLYYGLGPCYRDAGVPRAQAKGLTDCTSVCATGLDSKASSRRTPAHLAHMEVSHKAARGTLSVCPLISLPKPLWHLSWAVCSANGVIRSEIFVHETLNTPGVPEMLRSPRPSNLFYLFILLFFKKFIYGIY